MARWVSYFLHLLSSNEATSEPRLMSCVHTSLRDSGYKGPRSCMDASRALTWAKSVVASSMQGTLTQYNCTGIQYASKWTLGMDRCRPTAECKGKSCSVWRCDILRHALVHIIDKIVSAPYAAEKFVKGYLHLSSADRHQHHISMSELFGVANQDPKNGCSPRLAHVPGEISSASAGSRCYGVGGLILHYRYTVIWSSSAILSARTVCECNGNSRFAILCVEPIWPKFTILAC